jgi:hypothetical protein
MEWGIRFRAVLQNNHKDFYAETKDTQRCRQAVQENRDRQSAAPPLAPAPHSDFEEQEA